MTPLITIPAVTMGMNFPIGCPFLYLRMEIATDQTVAATIACAKPNILLKTINKTIGMIDSHGFCFTRGVSGGPDLFGSSSATYSFCCFRERITQYAVKFS